MEKDFESLKNERGPVEGLVADLGPDRVAAPGPEAGPGLVAAPGPAAGPGRTPGPSPETVLNQEVAPNRPTGMTPRKMGAKTGPSLAASHVTDPSHEIALGRGRATVPIPNQNRDLAPNLEMIKKKDITIFEL